MIDQFNVNEREQNPAYTNLQTYMTLYVTATSVSPTSNILLLSCIDENMHEQYSVFIMALNKATLCWL